MADDTDNQPAPPTTLLVDSASHTQAPASSRNAPANSPDSSAQHGIANSTQDALPSAYTTSTTTTTTTTPISSPTTTTITTTTTTATTTTTTTTSTTTPNAPPMSSSPAEAQLKGREEAFLGLLIDDVIYGECLQVHRAAKLGYIFTEPNDELYQIKDGTGLDVFGQSLARPKKSMLCTCPQCNRNIAASRLAPHLEKCMGMGRLSARAASSKRDPNNTGLT